MANSKETAVRDGGSRRWLFAQAVLDERSLTLTVAGENKALDPKPLEVLLHMLRHAGEVVTKDELLAAVWPGRIISDSALTSCIARLRDGLADGGQTIIKTVHGYGYRLIAPVKVEASMAEAPARFAFKPGDALQDHPNWKLVERLGTGGHGEAWLARHEKTGEPRVFKYALDPEAVPSLKREITLSRYLHDTLGDDAPFVRVLDWNLDAAPFCIQAEYTQGGNLTNWAQAHGGIAQIPVATRIDFAIQIAEALALAHSVGVLHKDLKPSNVLIDAKAGGLPRIRLSDFGSGGVLEPGKLDALGITRMGLTMTQGMSATSGTPIYLAPELIAEQPATMQTDIYAMGVLLYQLAIGDLKRPLAPGWEDDVSDETLRADIAAAAAGNPARRLANAAELVERLRSLEQRRTQHLAEQSVAVLPFVNLTGDPANDYLSDGLADELISSLTHVEDVRVPSRAATLVWKGKAPLEIGRALNVKTVLEGSVRGEPGKLRVEASLTRVADRASLWSQGYERAAGDVLWIQRELTHAVVSALKPQLRAEECDGVGQGTANPVAYDLYLRGRYLARRTDEAKNTEGLALLERAVKMDPAFARCHAYCCLGRWARTMFIAPDDRAALKAGFAAADRALTIDPKLAEAHHARAMLAFTPAGQFACGLAIKELKRAVALNGKFALASAMLANVYVHAGLLDEAELANRRAVELDPDDPQVAFMGASLPVWTGDYERGLDALEQQPHDWFNTSIWYWHTAWALRALGRVEEAEARVEGFLNVHKDTAGLLTATHAQIHAMNGRRDEAELAISKALSVDQRFGHFHHTAYEIACAYALMGRRAEAFKYLDQAVRTGFPCCPIIEREPAFKDCRNDPDFLKVLELPRRQAEQYKAL